MFGAVQLEQFDGQRMQTPSYQLQPWSLRLDHIYLQGKLDSLSIV